MQHSIEDWQYMTAGIAIPNVPRRKMFVVFSLQLRSIIISTRDHFTFLIGQNS